MTSSPNIIVFTYAAMAELVDALDSGSSQGSLVDVRVILAAKFLPDIFFDLIKEPTRVFTNL